jgi:pimeloyl-ACP methyl ester carboxylesterase
VPLHSHSVTPATSVMSLPLALGAAGAIAGALAGKAVSEWRHARRVEARHPPKGRFITLDGVRLHYFDTGGSGSSVVLLHGNATSVDDMEASGLVSRLSRNHRVVAFDRPGFGFSSRPRTRLWTPAAQARLLASALRRLDVRHPVIVGHSWGTLVALALAFENESSIAGLVLLAGYYFPTFRIDAVMNAPAALPLLGDILNYTIMPSLTRLSLPRMLKKQFRPKPIAAAFLRHFPIELISRPWQIRAQVEEGALMVPAASALQSRYKSLHLPIIVIAGVGDRVVSVQRQSARLAGELRYGDLLVLPGLGHMVHYAAGEEIERAVDTLSGIDGGHRITARDETLFALSSANIPPDAETAVSEGTDT